MLIVVTGPESSGKSTLAAYLSDTMGVNCVSEYARVYMESKLDGYQYEDVLAMASGQSDRINEVLSENGGLVISDTGKFEFLVWLNRRFGGKGTAQVEEIFRGVKPALYLLCKPDLAWRYDPLRENPHDREDLYQDYLQHIEASGVPFIIVSGGGESRNKNAHSELAAALEKVIP